MIQLPREFPPVPSLTVAMSVYNGERFLGAAIESVLAQTFTDFEFLILDDGSSDATPAMLRDFANRDARIRPIIRENRGLVASLNQLLAEARAPLVARMDADDICHPERFAHQIAFLAANPDHGVVGSWSEDIDEHDERWQIEGADHPVSHEDFLHNIRHGGPLLVHPGVMYRRELVLAQGGYHKAFLHCEDLDLWLRLASVTKIANIPVRLIRYRHYSGQVSQKYATVQQTGAAVAYEAWRVREAGLPDPTATLDQLPTIDGLDALFGDPGVAQRVRARVTGGILYSPIALRDEGFDIVLRHLRDSGERAGMWRTVGRLVRFGEPMRAAKLAAALVGA